MNTIEEIQQAVMEGKHDFKDVGDVYTRINQDNQIMFAYLPTCTFKSPSEWNFLEQVSRGLILDRNTGEVVARPFSKFWNWGQGDLWTDAPIRAVYEKVDGSLGIFYRTPKNKIRVATRGSFESDQAIKANSMWYKHVGNVVVPENWTLLAEIIYPENRIVVDYGGWEGFIVLGARDRFTGEYIPWESVQDWVDFAQKKSINESIRAVTRFDLGSVEDIVAKCRNELDMNMEGFVVEFEDDHRFKFKGLEYLNAHRLVSNMTEKNVHQSFLDGTVDEMREALPDEFVSEFDDIVKSIETFVNRCMFHIHDTYQTIVYELGEEFTQKEYALRVQKEPKYMWKYLFILHSSGGQAAWQKVCQDYMKLKDST